MDVGCAEGAFTDELIDGEGSDAAGDTVRGLGHCDHVKLPSGWRPQRRIVPFLERVGRRWGCRRGLILRVGEGLGEESEGEDCGEGAGDSVGHGSFLRG